MKRFLVVLLLPITLMASNLGFFSCDDHVWLSGEGLLLRPTIADNYFAVLGATYTESIVNAGLLSPRGTNQTLTPGYCWGYGIEAGFRSCRKDLRLAWESLNTAYNLKLQANASQELWPNLLESFEQASQNQNGSMRYKEIYKWNQLDGDVGFWVCALCRTWARLFMGVRYTRFEVDRSARVFVATGAPVGQVFAFSDSQGIGPRVGLGLRVCIWDGLFLRGQLATGLLVGSTKGRYTSEDFSGSSGLLQASFSPSVRNNSNTLIIPETDIHFGFGYDLCLCGLALTGEVGYRIDHYFSGLQNNIYQTVNIINVDAPPLTDRTFNGYPTGGNSHPTQPFSLDGWYIRLAAEY